MRGHSVILFSLKDGSFRIVDTYHNNLPLAWIDDSPDGVRCLYTNLAVDNTKADNFRDLGLPERLKVNLAVKDNVSGARLLITDIDGKEIYSVIGHDVSTRNSMLGGWNAQTGQVWWWVDAGNLYMHSNGVFRLLTEQTKTYMAVWDYKQAKDQSIFKLVFNFPKIIRGW